MEYEDLPAILSTADAIEAGSYFTVSISMQLRRLLAHCRAVSVRYTGNCRSSDSVRRWHPAGGVPAYAWCLQCLPQTP